MQKKQNNYFLTRPLAYAEGLFFKFMHHPYVIRIFLGIIFLYGCNTPPPIPKLISPNKNQLLSLRVGTLDLLADDVQNIPIDKPIVISFLYSLDLTTTSASVELKEASTDTFVASTIYYLDDNKTISILPNDWLSTNITYSIEIKTTLKGINGETFEGYKMSFTTLKLSLEVSKATIGSIDVTTNNRIIDIELNPKILVYFNNDIQPTDVEDRVFITSTGDAIIPTIQSHNSTTLQFSVDTELEPYTKFRFFLSPKISVKNKNFEGYEFIFYTKVDATPKFSLLTEAQLLDKVQEYTFKYFWDFAHPTSGLARERNTSGETVTTGGSGFGLMAIIVAIERGFITRSEGVNRWATIVNFLNKKTEKFHGVWSHWLHGGTGKTIPFGSKDDGGDLVESAFLMQGLITVRQYLDAEDDFENELIEKINVLWEAMEWDWYRKNNENKLYWHWSKNYGWDKNLPIRGWNESLIVYVLAASSPTHPIPLEVYENGWANNGNMRNGNDFYNTTLPLGSAWGGPLFFSHYSFLGLDPRKLSDKYAVYWDQNVAHSKINFNYCVDNPKGYVGYSANSWGLTASDNHNGYSAHSPDNDLGVITPTAAISSLPYTPEESMQAIKHFYYILGDKLWGEYGFYDAFNVTEGWYAQSYLAIDQGPIICMIENHRTGLLWNLFMSAPEIQNGLKQLNFSYN